MAQLVEHLPCMTGRQGSILRQEGPKSLKRSDSSIASCSVTGVSVTGLQGRSCKQMSVGVARLRTLTVQWP